MLKPQDRAKLSSGLVKHKECCFLLNTAIVSLRKVIKPDYTIATKTCIKKVYNLMYLG
jgi:hypothetical protein